MAASRRLQDVAAWAPVLGLILAPLAAFLAMCPWRLKDDAIVRELTLDTDRRVVADAVVLPVFGRTCLRALGMALITLLGGNGLLNAVLLGLVTTRVSAFMFNRAAVLIMLSVLHLPFTILPIVLALERIPGRLLVASADLGWPFGRPVRHVIGRLSGQGALVGAAFTGVLALGDVVTPPLVGDPGGLIFGRIARAEPGLAAEAALAHTRGLGESVLNTLLVGSRAVTAALVLGTAPAFWYQARPGRQRELLQAIPFLPFLLPPSVTGRSLLICRRELGVPRSLGTVGIGHSMFVLALVHRIVLNRLQVLRPSLVEASADPGASGAPTLRHVILPHPGSALAAAAVLAFAPSFDETMITLLVTDTESTVPMRLWGMMRTGFTPDLNAPGALLRAATALLCRLVARLVEGPAA